MFKIRNPKQFEFGSKLTVAAPIKGESVFGIGAPLVSKRKIFGVGDYPKTFGVRATFGKVIDANNEHKSFCQFTNEDDGEPETWKLEAVCKEPPKKGHNEEKDPFLTDTDMTFGMSGSPLFNAKGEFIGVGSNVLSADPENFHEGKYAAYVKATYITQLATQSRF